MNAIQDVYRPTISPTPAPLRWTVRCILAVALLLALKWAIWDSVLFSTGPEACEAASGACWSVVTSNWKFVLFGTYPFEALWRPIIATLVLILAFVIPCTRPRLAVLAASWALGLGLAISLLDGRPFFLAPVETREWGGLPLTLLLSEGVMFLAFPLGLAAALARQSDSVLLRSVALVLVECIRGVPLVSLLFFAIQVLPLFFSSLSSLNKLSAATAAIVLFNAAYISEVIRGGLLSVPRGQFDAANAIGLRWSKVHLLVILPQAFRACAPSLVNHMVGVVKDTTFVVIVGLFDFMNTAKLTLADVSWQLYFVEIYVLVGLAYFMLCASVSFLGARLTARSDGRAPSRQPSDNTMPAASTGQRSIVPSGSTTR